MDKEDKTILAFNYELGQIFNVLDGLSYNFESYTWLCLACKKQIFYSDVLGYFQHKGNKACGFEPETIEHKTMKSYWYENFPKFNPIKTKVLEKKVGDQIVDVYFELQNDKKIAIECQNSQISKKKLIERTKNYTKKDIYVLWIFNGIGTCVSDSKNPRNEEDKAVLGVEKRVHSLYGGRVYYMNVTGSTVIEPPYCLHFAPFFQHKTSDVNYFGYDKYYKDKRSTVTGSIPSLKILCVEYKGYKLARLMDKHVSSLCTEQVVRSLREYCYKTNIKSEIDDKFLRIPLKSIISSVEKRFGFFLPYLILKKSNKIKKIKIERILDNDYKVQDVILIRTSDYL